MESNIVGFDKMGEKIKYSYSPSFSVIACHLGPLVESGTGQKLHMEMEVEVDQTPHRAEDMGLVLFLCYCCYLVARYCPICL